MVSIINWFFCTCIYIRTYIYACSEQPTPQHNQLAAVDPTVRPVQLRLVGGAACSRLALVGPTPRRLHTVEALRRRGRRVASDKTSTLEIRRPNVQHGGGKRWQRLAAAVKGMPILFLYSPPFLNI